MYGFDGEPTRWPATMAFERAGIDAECARFEERCHADALEEMARTRPRAFGAVTFNLGYLPGDEDAKTSEKDEERTRRRRFAPSRRIECASGWCRHRRGVSKHEAGGGTRGGSGGVARVPPTKSRTVTERRVLNRNAAPVLYVARRAAE